MQSKEKIDYRETIESGCHCGFSNTPWFCSKSLPHPSKLEFISNLAGRFRSKIFRMGAEVIKVFNFSIAFN